MRLRLLPVLVVAACLALTARVGDLWYGLSGTAQAQTAEPTAAEPAAVEPAPNAEAKTRAKAAPNATATPTDGERNGLSVDPFSMTDEEIELLQALAERRQELEFRARQLEQREALLQAAERRIEEKVAGLKALQRSIEARLQQQEDDTESQYRSLVKIYESMKPKDAARIFNELDMAVLLPVVERMKERKTAPILAKMNPTKAKAITTQLAKRGVPGPADAETLEETADRR